MAVELDVNAIIRRLATKNADLTTQLTIAEVTQEQMQGEINRLESELASAREEADPPKEAAAEEALVD